MSMFTTPLQGHYQSASSGTLAAAAVGSVPLKIKVPPQTRYVQLYSDVILAVEVSFDSNNTPVPTLGSFVVAALTPTPLLVSAEAAEVIVSINGRTTGANVAVQFLQ